MKYRLRKSAHSWSVQRQDIVFPFAASSEVRPMSGKSIQRLRRKKCLPQQELAAAAGVKTRTVQNWERHGCTRKATVELLKTLFA